MADRAPLREHTQSSTAALRLRWITDPLAMAATTVLRLDDTAGPLAVPDRLEHLATPHDLTRRPRQQQAEQLLVEITQREGEEEKDVGDEVIDPVATET